MDVVLISDTKADRREAMEHSSGRRLSREAYREAMRVLAAKGLIETRPRAGSRVLARDQWEILAPDMHDVRRSP
jgi:DNA-binding FadR family transcriptional regulator